MDPELGHGGAVVILERSLEPITRTDLSELFEGSKKRLQAFFLDTQGSKWLKLYDIENPIAVALCQGAALHFCDGRNGVKDFDVWFFYPFNQKHLPYRTIWSWDYGNPKFGKHPALNDHIGRKVDVIVRSIRHHVESDPIATIVEYLEREHTSSARALAKKAVVLISPHRYIGKIVWWRGRVE